MTSLLQGSESLLFKCRFMTSLILSYDVTNISMTSLLLSWRHYSRVMKVCCLNAGLRIGTRSVSTTMSFFSYDLTYPNIVTSPFSYDVTYPNIMTSLSRLSYDVTLFLWRHPSHMTPPFSYDVTLFLWRHPSPMTSLFSYDVTYPNIMTSLSRLSYDVTLLLWRHPSPMTSPFSYDVTLLLWRHPSPMTSPFSYDVILFLWHHPS